MIRKQAKAAAPCLSWLSGAHTCSLDLAGSASSIFCNCEPLRGDDWLTWAALPCGPALPRCAWVEININTTPGSKSPCSRAWRHFLCPVSSLGAGLVGGSERPRLCGWPSVSGALLDFLQQLPGCHLLKKRMCHPYLLLEFLPGQRWGRKKAVGAGTGRVSQSGKWKSSRRAPRARTILAGLQAPSRPACCHSCGSMALPLGFQVLVYIQVFYLGRVGIVQQQLAWGSAHVYSQMPRHGAPALQWGRLLRGGCWLNGRRFPTTGQLQNCLQLEQVPWYGFPLWNWWVLCFFSLFRFWFKVDFIPLFCIYRYKHGNNLFI